MEASGTFALGVLGGIAGALVTDFLRGPFRQFFTRRTEVRQQLLMIASITPPDPGWRQPAFTKDEIDRLTRPNREAEHMLRTFGTWMMAFAETEPLPAWCVKLWGYDPLEAARGLIGLSNTISTHGAERATHRTRINTALKLPE